MRNGEWPIPPSNNWVRLGCCAPIPSGKLYRHYAIAKKLYRRMFYCYDEICEAWRARPTKGGNNVRVIYTIRIRIERNSAAFGMLIRDLIPNIAPKNSADPTIFQFLNYGNI
jgi:hypothetical protein